MKYEVGFVSGSDNHNCYWGEFAENFRRISSKTTFNFLLTGDLITRVRIKMRYFTYITSLGSIYLSGVAPRNPIFKSIKRPLDINFTFFLFHTVWLLPAYPIGYIVTLVNHHLLSLYKKNNSYKTITDKLFSWILYLNICLWVGHR